MKKQDIKEEVKKHEQEYWHIRKINLFPLLLMLLFIGLAIANMFVVRYEWNRLELGDLSCSENNCNYKSAQLMIIYPLIFECLFIVLSAISLVALIKGGYKNLNKVNEEGIIAGIRLGIILEIIVGIMVGITAGIHGGTILGILMGTITGIIGGTLLGIFIGIIMELYGNKGGV